MGEDVARPARDLHEKWFTVCDARWPPPNRRYRKDYKIQDFGTCLLPPNLFRKIEKYRGKIVIEDIRAGKVSAGLQQVLK